MYGCGFIPAGDTKPVGFPVFTAVVQTIRLACGGAKKKTVAERDTKPEFNYIFAALLAG